MGKFTEFSSKEELIAAIEAEIVETQNDDGVTVYSLNNKDAENYRAKYEAEVKNSQAQRKNKQAAEKELAEMRALNESLAEQVEELNKLNPEDLRKSLQQYVNEKTELAKKIKELQAEVEPLREENAAFKAEKTTATIKKALLEEARKRNCRDSALRDVERLAGDFIVDPDTDLIVREKDQKLVSEVLDEEIALSPHWLQPSQGGGANPSPTGNVSNEAKFQQALKGNDFDAVLANAPRVQVR